MSSKMLYYSLVNPDGSVSNYRVYYYDSSSDRDYSEVSLKTSKPDETIAALPSYEEAATLLALDLAIKRQCCLKTEPWVDFLCPLHRSAAVN